MKILPRNNLGDMAEIYCKKTAFMRNKKRLLIFSGLPLDIRDTGGRRNIYIYIYKSH